ncbi:hypothetical protein RB195_006560 [Necator americanus]|uniref:Uncharacterized protein n=1 Tax=Necator americanus TaxID=51031 RepID=A0ABR1BWW2_NECAM
MKYRSFKLEKSCVCHYVITINFKRSDNVSSVNRDQYESWLKLKQIKDDLRIQHAKIQGQSNMGSTPNINSHNINS